MPTATIEVRDSEGVAAVVSYTWRKDAYSGKVKVEGRLAEVVEDWIESESTGYDPVLNSYTGPRPRWWSWISDRVLASVNSPFSPFESFKIKNAPPASAYPEREELPDNVSA